ncbi:MAG: riboflavin kinase [Candidatus Kerfeldbacteria bacterium]|nr:riboflavin kinase [Candidatus Kerfeldbacteria bacterium]
MKPVVVQGMVIRGEQIGERQGYPTANFSGSVLRGTGLTAGVYVARTVLRGRSYRALAVFGVPGKRIQKRGKTELYILNHPNRVLYGQRISFIVYKKIRPLYWYQREAALLARIRRDIRIARAYRYPTQGNI